MAGSGRRVLVTGAAGLLGREVVNAFAVAGFEVHAVDLVPPAGPSPAIRFDVADVAAWGGLGDALRECKALVHVAAVTDVAGTTPQKLFESNVAMTSHALFSAAEAGVDKIVYASSQSALGFSRATHVTAPDYLPVDEVHRCHVNETYGLSKLVGEQLAQVIAVRFRVPVLALRFPVIWAPGTAESHVRLRLGDPTQAAKSFWSYVDVRDAARATVIGLERDTGAFEVLNIAARWSFGASDINVAADGIYGPVRRTEATAPDGTIFSVKKAERLLGFRARYRWSPEGIEEIGE